MVANKTKHIQAKWDKLFGKNLGKANRAEIAYLENPEKFKNLAKKGIPTEYRWEVWKTLVGMQDLIDAEKYEELVVEGNKMDENDPLLRQITVDVNRSFTWYPYFDKNISDKGLKKLQK